MTEVATPRGSDRRFLVVGESLVDLVRRPGEADVARVGGSPLNVAVGLSRLDAHAALWTTFGTDAYGALVAKHLEVNDVEVAPGSVRSGRTSTAVAMITGDGSARYTFDLGWDPQPVAGLAPRLVHTGSIAAVLEPGASRVASAISAMRASATVSFDPNVRSQLLGEHDEAVSRIEAFVALSDIVKASDEDLAWLYPGEPQEEVAQRWRGLGPSVVVVTRGGSGAFAVARGATASVPAPLVEVVDTIGAGDSFMAGLLVALDDLGLLGRARAPRLRDIGAESLRDALELAAACAALTVGRDGADPPTRRDVEAVYEPGVAAR